MPNIIAFNFQTSQQVRTALHGDEPYFCLKDVAEILAIQNVSQIVAKQLDVNGCTKITVIDNLNRQQQATFISEPNLYRVIFRSNKPEAVKFQNWVFDEVLPAIRKTGQYRHTTADDRTPLRQAVSMLVGKKKLGYDAAYHLVHQYMGVNHIDEIALEDLPKAVAYVHSLMFHSSEELYNVLCGCFEHLRDYAKIARFMNAVHSEQIDQVLRDIVRIGKQMNNRHNRPMFEKGRMNYYQGNAMILK